MPQDRHLAMKEASGRGTEVILAAMVRPERAPVLDWLDPYSEKGQRGEPNFYNPRTDEHGSVFYRVPLTYAERLLSGNAGKFVVVHPEKVRVQVATRSGGKEWKLLFAKVRKRPVGKNDEELPVVKDALGKPLWFDEDEVEVDMVKVRYGNS